jgi:predicted Rossmann fold nucleotide-binding protein DprA/Smf involved in DNA uptake
MESLMVDPFLLACLEEPLRETERINRIWLPSGRKPISNLTEAERQASAAQQRARTAARKKKVAGQRDAMLDQYAKSDVPFDRIAANLGMKIEDVRDEMKKRGRLS